MRDPYEILQVSRNAEPEVIEAAYRRLARKYHPDVSQSPYATATMKDLNWAYEILRDPIERARYDHSRPPATPPSAQTPYAAPSYPPPRQQARPSSRQEPFAPPPRAPLPQRPFLQRYWPWIAIAALALYLVTRSPATDQGPSLPAANPPRSPTRDPYLDCIAWQSAVSFDGQVKCVLGRILVVTYEFDSLSGGDVWTAHFSFDPEKDFRLVSVNRDISQWEGQCVSAYGKLSDRDLIRDYVDNPQPSMVDADPFDDRGFSISSAPEEHC